MRETTSGIWRIYRNQAEENTLVYTKYTVLGCSRDRCRDYKDEMEVQRKEAAEMSYETLLEENAEAWNVRWEAAEVRIDGDEKLQEGLRFSVYHLIRCYNGMEERTQVCAKGFEKRTMEGISGTVRFICSRFIFTPILRQPEVC